MGGYPPVVAMRLDILGMLAHFRSLAATAHAAAFRFGDDDTNNFNESVNNIITATTDYDPSWYPSTYRGAKKSISPHLVATKKRARGY